jgi:hypothetical protein
MLAGRTVSLRTEGRRWRSFSSAEALLYATLAFHPPCTSISGRIAMRSCSLADVEILLTQDVRGPCLRFVSRPVGDLQRANAARDGRRNVVRVAVPSADCSLGLGIDYACRGDSDELPGKVLNFRITLLIAVGIPSIGSATPGGLSKRPRPGCTITNRVSSTCRPILFSEFCGAARARSPR